MLAVTRRNQIREILLEKKSVTVTELAGTFDVTEETIRRDLQLLENEGFLSRTYGGAFITEGVLNEVDLTLRETAYLDSKEKIAAQCASLVHHGDTVFLDASTTAAVVSKWLRNMRITVVTNSLMVVDQLKDAEPIHLILIGGTYSAKSKAFNGGLTLQDLRNYYVDKTFMSCRSVSLEHGVTDSNEELAELRRLLLTASNQVYLIADRSKIGKTSFVRICDFESIDGLISDHTFDDEWKQFLEEKNVTLYECE